MSCAAPDLGEEGSRYSGKEEGSHEDCPTAERRGQSRGLPLQAERRGQSQGLLLRRKEEGSHKDCPYGRGRDCPYGGKKRAVTRTAPTAVTRTVPTAERRGQSRTVPTAERRGQSRALRRKQEGSHEDCAYSDLAQVANLRYRLPGISVCSTFSIQAQAVKALETIRRASFSSPSLWFTYGLSLQ